MTKKDFELIAQAIEAVVRRYPVDVLPLLRVASSVADSLAEDNPKFDRARFLTACGVAK